MTNLIHPSDAAVDPEGRLLPPARSPSPLLDLQIRARVQPYDERDATGTFIIDAPVRISSQHHMSIESTCSQASFLMVAFLFPWPAIRRQPLSPTRRRESGAPLQHFRVSEPFVLRYKIRHYASTSLSCQGQSELDWQSVWFRSERVQASI